MSCLARCPECPHKVEIGTVREVVPGDGPLDARIMAIAESPGKDENAKTRCMIGRTGKEFNQLYLPMGGLRREDIYTTNTVKCWPRSDRDISDEIVASCAGFHLRAEIFTIKPTLVILMGAVACSLAGIDVDMEHGFPREGEILGYKVMIFPMYHPALGMHDYAMMSTIMDDWNTLRRFLAGEEISPPEDKFPNPQYTRLRTRRDVEISFTLCPPWSGRPLAIDTEYDPLPVGINPYCLTYSHTPGTGYLIKKEDKEAVREFSGIVGGVRVPGTTPQFKGGLSSPNGWAPGRGWMGPVLLHNALADLPVTEALDIWLNMHKVHDTMVLAYNLCTLPQGLKVLAYRLCGMRMTEFDDLVTPYAVAYWLAYVEMISETEFPKPEPYMRLVPEKTIVEVDGMPVTVGTHMVEKLYKPQSISTKIRRLMTDYRKTPGPKVFKRMFEWDAIEWEPVIAEYGPIPKKSITQVDDEQTLLSYACADADGTLRIYPELLHLRHTFRARNRV